MSLNVVTLLYLVASVCFIQALKGLSHPTTSIRGNLPDRNVAEAVARLPGVSAAPLDGRDGRDLALDQFRPQSMLRVEQHLLKRAKYPVVDVHVHPRVKMHEDPQVPNFCSPAFRKNHDFEIEPGLVIAVEPMVNMGTKKVRVLADHWTQSTVDGLPSAHFEHTVAITEAGPLVLTAPPAEGEMVGTAA